MARKMGSDSGHFRQFATSLEAIICGYDTDEDHYTRQKRQVERLYGLEKEFRAALIRDYRGPTIYKSFVKFVRDEKHNILSARPYFRERQDVFKARIAPALRERSDKALYKFDINYPFIAFALKSKRFAPGSRVAKLARQVEASRKELIEMNIPLAISRARVFMRYRQVHLEYMDLVQVAIEGLIAAIDKFVLPYQKSYGAVMYGRITGDLVECNSETLVHYWPRDKKLLYAVNKMVTGGKTFTEIAEHINTEAEKKKPGTESVTNEHELQQIYVGAYTVSGDSAGPDDDSEAESEPPIHRFAADDSWRPDVRFERVQLLDALTDGIKGLTLFERKLLAMKGITV
jgi:DNA-directed RNA polymerase specialized sigma subunit